jgi:hypothetical protein
MRQQILNLKKKLLIVELPERSQFVSVEGDELYYTAPFLGMSEIGHFTKLNFPVKLIGKLTEITEEQFADFISSKWMLTTNSDNVLRYKDYMAVFDPYNKKTAKESFFSYLEANGVYFENPLDWEKKAYFLKDSENSWGHDDLKRWQEAEGKVLNLNTCYIFEIL